MSKTLKRERQKENRERAREERARLMKRDRRMKTVRNLTFLLAPIVIIAIIISVTGKDNTSASAFDKNKGYTATVATSEGNIVLALDAKNAPIATKHFVDLANRGYYKGTCFDRLAKGFVIQGGSPKCEQQGGAGNSVVGELPTNNYPIGSLAAAKTGADPKGTFDAQFFIVTGAQGDTLPNDYARFGTVTSGLDVAQKIEGLPTQPGTEKPASVIKITGVTITVTDKPATTTSSVATTPKP